MIATQSRRKGEHISTFLRLLLFGRYFCGVIWWDSLPWMISFASFALMFDWRSRAAARIHAMPDSNNDVWWKRKRPFPSWSFFVTWKRSRAVKLRFAVTATLIRETEISIRKHTRRKYLLLSIASPLLPYFIFFQLETRQMNMYSLQFGRFRIFGAIYALVPSSATNAAYLRKSLSLLVRWV